MPDRIDQLVTLLRALPPRSLQALSFRLLDGLPRESCAHAYGIHPQAFDVMLYRAARQLTAAEQGRPPPVEPFAVEKRAATALAAALASPAADNSKPADRAAALPGPAEAQLLAEVGRNAARLRSALAEAERAEEASPRHRRIELVRRIMVIAVLLLTAYLYLQARTPS
jgi:hypothetical protein